MNPYGHIVRDMIGLGTGLLVGSVLAYALIDGLDIQNGAAALFVGFCCGGVCSWIGLWIGKRVAGVRWRA